MRSIKESSAILKCYKEGEGGGIGLRGCLDGSVVNANMKPLMLL